MVCPRPTRASLRPARWGTAFQLPVFSGKHCCCFLTNSHAHSCVHMDMGIHLRTRTRSCISRESGLASDSACVLGTTGALTHQESQSQNQAALRGPPRPRGQPRAQGSPKPMVPSWSREGALGCLDLPQSSEQKKGPGSLPMQPPVWRPPWGGGA